MAHVPTRPNPNEYPCPLSSLTNWRDPPISPCHCLQPPAENFARYLLVENSSCRKFPSI
jgi:hypothetical protein